MKKFQPIKLLKINSIKRNLLELIRAFIFYPELESQAFLVADLEYQAFLVPDLELQAFLVADLVLRIVLEGHQVESLVD